MKLGILLATVFLLIAALIGRWFFLNFEYVDYREAIGMSKEAKRNPYLASQRLMTQMGIPTSELRTLAGIGKLPPNGVLVIGEERDVLTPQTREALLAWVQQGGYLVTEDIGLDKKDPLLDSLDVRREEVDEDERSERIWPLVEIRLPGATRALNVQMHEWQSIERKESLIYARSENANHVLHFRWGRGHITILNSMWFMTNGGLGKHDHAEFLNGLLRLAPDRESIAFFNQPEDLSLWDWLLEHAWVVLATGGLALLLWLWQVGPRFGPIAEDPRRERRSLLEHLRACGRFEWAAKNGPQLAEAARELAWRRIARAHPELALMSVENSYPYLAKLYALHEDDIRRLRATTSLRRDENDFIRSIQAYQRIHEHLEPRADTRGEIITGEKP